MPRVQFWQTKYSWRLDHSYRGCRRRVIPRMVDAARFRSLIDEFPSPAVDTGPDSIVEISPLALIDQITSSKRANACSQQQRFLGSTSYAGVAFRYEVPQMGIERCVGMLGRVHHRFHRVAFEEKHLETAW